MEALQEVDDSAIEPFLGAADALLAAIPDARAALARALAKLSGHTSMQVCTRVIVPAAIPSAWMTAVSYTAQSGQI